MGRGGGVAGCECGCGSECGCVCMHTVFHAIDFSYYKHAAKASMCSLGPTPRPPDLCVIVIDL